MPERSSKRRAIERKREREIESRRTFIKRAAILTSVLAAGGGILYFLNRNREATDLETQQAEKELRKRLMPSKVELSPEEREVLFGEKWLESIEIDQGPDFLALPREEKMAKFEGEVEIGFREVLEMMKVSANPFYSQVSQFLTHYATEVDPTSILNGYIKLGKVWVPPDDYRSSGMFLSGAHLDENGRWYMNLSVNIPIFDEISVSDFDPRIRAKMNIASGLVHEVLGHWVLAREKFDFWLSQGLSQEAAFEKVKDDPDQEPFSYWIQMQDFNVMLSLGGEYQQKALPNFLLLSEKQKELEEKGLSWYSEEWRGIVVDYQHAMDLVGKTVVRWGDDEVVGGVSFI